MDFQPARPHETPRLPAQGTHLLYFKPTPDVPPDNMEEMFTLPKTFCYCSQVQT
jgi:hypothetical protein